jgi:hypothetical protein
MILEDLLIIQEHLIHLAQILNHVFSTVQSKDHQSK